jgi:hypothetical protein
VWRLTLSHKREQLGNRNPRLSSHPPPCTSATVALWFPFTAARIEDLGPVDFMVCNNVGLLSARFLLSLGFPPYTSIKSLQRHARCRAAASGARATSRSGGGRRLPNRVVQTT